MNIVFRADASLEIGTGHVMRCLTLAEELSHQNYKIHFICRNHQGHLASEIERKGFTVTLLPASTRISLAQEYKEDYATWLGAPQIVDAAQTINAIDSDKPSWLIVDHYGIDHHWETLLRPYVKKIFVIDDLANRKHDCDLLLDQNFHESPDRYKSLVPTHTQLLLGPKFALLREEFRNARQFSQMRGNGIARILVYYGGIDQDNLTALTLEALNKPDLRHLFVDIVIGHNNPHKESLLQQTSQRPNTRLHIQPCGFVELMLRADYCIGAGGGNTWERLCLGLPSTVVAVANNQIQPATSLHKAGHIPHLFTINNININDIYDNILSITSRDRITFDQKFRIVDGLGTLRVIEAMSPSSSNDIKLRKAKQQDVEIYFEWSNETTTRQNSLNSTPISWQEHTSWFNAKLSSNTTFMYILYNKNGLPVGQIRFDRDDGTTNISYSLDSLVRGRGWGKILIELGMKQLNKKTQNQTFKAIVKETNIASRKVFTRLGFDEIHRDRSCIFIKQQATP